MGLFSIFRKKARKDINKNNAYSGYSLSRDLNKNIKMMDEIFENDDTVIKRSIANNADKTIQCCLFFSDGMIDNKIINEGIVYPVQAMSIEKDSQDICDILIKRVIRINEASKTNDMEKIIQAVAYGDTALFADGSDYAILLNTKGFQLRSIEEPESEKILQGPREGFTEGIIRNLTMLKRRIRNPALKIKYRTFGTRTQTKASICYIEGIAKQEIIDELNARLDKLDMDGFLDVNYIIEQIRDSPHSLFKTIGVTERPDVVAGKLLEGRIALFLDGTPMVMTLPYLFIENFQSNEDYYMNFFYSTITRCLRILGFAITICLPGAYVAIVTYHHEMLPTPLLVSIAAARQSVPFPTIIETIIMLIVFQILVETGIRMPTGIGQALSIVGALVIGQAAVEAKIVSAPIIIVVSFTGITGLILPKLNNARIIIRFVLLLFATFLGLYGVTFGIIILFIHLFKLRSFGVPYIPDLLNLNYQENKDVFFRSPWWKMKLRPPLIAQDIVRMKNREDN